MNAFKMSKILSIATLVVGLGAFHSAGAAVIINGVTWSNVYNPDASTYNFLPTAATPAWTNVASTGTAVVTGDHLAISTTDIANNQSYLNTNNWNGDGVSGMSVEARVQTVTSLGAGSPIGNIRIGTSTNYIYIGFDQNHIYYLSGIWQTIASGLDLSAYTTLRLTMAQNLALNIYVDNNSTPVGTLSAANFASAGGVNNIIFGDITGSSGGASNWDYIAYTAGVYPVPEPGSMALLGLGLLPICFALYRKRRSGSAG